MSVVPAEMRPTRPEGRRGRAGPTRKQVRSGRDTSISAMSPTATDDDPVTWSGRAARWLVWRAPPDRKDRRRGARLSAGFIAYRSSRDGRYRDNHQVNFTD